MLQNLLYQETRRKSFSNTDCIHKPAMLETPPQRWSGRGLLREHCPYSCPVAEDSRWRGTRLFKSWLSPPFQPHLLLQILPPRQDEGISSPQTHCGFLFLCLVSLGVSLPRVPFSSSSDSFSGFVTHFTFSPLEKSFSKDSVTECCPLYMYP